MKHLLVAVLAVACVDTRVRGGPSLFENVPLYRAPPPRCAKFSARGGARAACEEAQTLAQLYVRRLSTGDQVCLEGGFGDLPTAACLARALVADTGTNVVLLEVRVAQPSSKWFDRENHQFWFEEGALVDLYLADHGY